MTTAQLTLEELSEIVQEYIGENNIAVTSFTEAHNNIVGLLDKIGLILQLDTSFFDKLPEMNGTYLPLGKTIEEYYQDLILPTDYDAEGEGALKFYRPTYRPVTYDYTFGRRKIAESIKNNDVERAVNNAQELGSIVATEYKRLSDSVALLEYGLKRELLGKVADLICDAYDKAETLGTNIEDGHYYTDGTTTYVAVKSGTIGSDGVTKENALIPLVMVTEIARPTDETSGDAFIVDVKSVIERAEDVSEGNSLNGNTIGADEGLTFLVKQGVMPELQVYTLAQTYHLNEMGMGVTAKVIKDFGKPTHDVFAMLFDSRAIKLHKSYDAVRENLNGDGDFLNIFRHLEYTGFASRNAFIHIYVEPTVSPTSASVKQDAVTPETEEVEETTKK